jgi:hypothetical protein
MRLLEGKKFDTEYTATPEERDQIKTMFHQLLKQEYKIFETISLGLGVYSEEMEKDFVKMKDAIEAGANEILKKLSRPIQVVRPAARTSRTNQ